MIETRSISVMVLAALLVLQVLPVQAAPVPCSINQGSRVDSCSDCGPGLPAGAGGSISAGTCCHLTPAEPGDVSQLAVSASRRALSQGQSSLPVAFSSRAGDLPSGLSQSHSASSDSDFPPLESTSRTTILRN